MQVLAAAGARVVIADLPHLKASALSQCEALSRYGYEARFCELDVGSQQDWERVIAELAQDGLELDVLVCNAGINSPSAPENQSLDDWERILRVNLTGPFLGMQAVLPSMRVRGGGSIICIGSVSASVVTPPTPGLSNAAYHASKAGLGMLAKTVAINHARDGVRVNVVAPGSVLTPMLARGGKGAELMANTPMGRLADPAEIANAVLFLASDAASFITASTLTVDGGYSAV